MAELGNEEDVGESIERGSRKKNTIPAKTPIVRKRCKGGSEGATPSETRPAIRGKKRR